MSTPLSALSNIISSGIAAIESTYARHGGSTFPSMDEPFQPGLLEEDEMLCQTIDHVIAAASQLIALVKPAPRTVFEGACSFLLSASLQVVVSANLPEILREAGPQGLHIKDIGDKCGSDPQKIGRILRYLATNHIFRELSPDIFANNRASSVLDTGKSIVALKADPVAKYDNTFGIAAIVDHMTDETMKAGAYLADNVLDPQTSTSQEPADSPFGRTFRCGNVFEYFEQPGNEYSLRRFGAAMHGASSLSALGEMSIGFDWALLQQDARVVDVGGGIGSATLHLMKDHPHLRYVVQDRPKVIADAVKFWENEDPDALKSGRVELKEHDFFEPQPIKDASVFFLRGIIHDWPDAYARKILKHLCASAQSDTKLILNDFLVPYAADSNNLFSDIPGADVPRAPYPLLANLGTVSNRTVMVDLQMMVMLNAQERTIGQFIDLVEGTGWKLGSIGRSPKSLRSILVFHPVQV